MKDSKDIFIELINNNEEKKLIEFLENENILQLSPFLEEALIDAIDDKQKNIINILFTYFKDIKNDISRALQVASFKEDKDTFHHILNNYNVDIFHYEHNSSNVIVYSNQIDLVVLTVS